MLEDDIAIVLLFLLGHSRPQEPESLGLFRSGFNSNSTVEEDILEHLGGVDSCGALVGDGLPRSTGHPGSFRRLWHHLG